MTTNAENLLQGIKNLQTTISTQKETIKDLEQQLSSKENSEAVLKEALTNVS